MDTQKQSLNGYFSSLSFSATISKKRKDLNLYGRFIKPISKKLGVIYCVIFNHYIDLHIY